MLVVVDNEGVVFMSERDWGSGYFLFFSSLMVLRLLRNPSFKVLTGVPFTKGIARFGSFSLEEIRNAVFGYDRSKSPGLDGFLMVFFQDSCDLLKGELKNFLRNFLRGSF